MAGIRQPVAWANEHAALGDPHAQLVAKRSALVRSRARTQSAGRGARGSCGLGELRRHAERRVRVSTMARSRGRLATGYTSQTDDVESFELSPRAGVRLHLTTRVLPTGPLKRERLPRHRLVLRNLARVEGRNLFYTGETSNDSTLRFRNRVELQVPLNRNRVSEMVRVTCSETGSGSFHSTIRKGASPTGSASAPGSGIVALSTGVSRRSTSGRDRGTPRPKASSHRTTSSMFE